MGKKIVLLASSKREWGATAAVDTYAVQYATVIPTVIEPADRGRPERSATGMKFVLDVTGRTNGGNASAATLLCKLQEKDPLGNWLDIAESTMTPIVTSSAYLTTIIHPEAGRVTAAADTNAVIDKPLPPELRFVIDINGSTTATPSFTFGCGAELYD